MDNISSKLIYLWFILIATPNKYTETMDRHNIIAYCCMHAIIRCVWASCLFSGINELQRSTRLLNKRLRSTDMTTRAAFCVLKREGQSHSKDSRLLNKTENVCWECNWAAMYAYDHCQRTTRYPRELRDGHFSSSLWKLIVSRPQ